ncbi:hypothetical protein G6F65_016602 [Rhizopus arrhizus]|nr:hypothetical protein G6F65_016602 [Rhizopus arrhizus]
MPGIEGRAGERHLQHRHGGGAVVEDQRRGHAGRHLLDDGLRDGGDLRIGGADVHAGLEEHLDPAHARQRLRFDVLDVVDGGAERTLIGGNHAPGHRIRRQAGVLPDHGDDGDADIGEYIGGGAQRAERTDDADENGHHHEGIRLVERGPDQPEHAALRRCHCPPRAAQAGKYRRYRLKQGCAADETYFMKEVGSAGRRPAPAEAFKQQQQQHSVGWRGGVGVRGRREPIPGGLAAACSCARSCAHGKTGVGRPAQPARGMPRAHAADTPHSDTAPPLTDSDGCW